MHKCIDNNIMIFIKKENFRIFGAIPCFACQALNPHIIYCKK